MRPLASRMLLIALGAAALAALPFTTRAGDPQDAAAATDEAFEEAAEAPPAPQAESRSDAPSTAHVWIGGFWGRRAGAWVWIPGRWALPPAHRCRWIPGHWRRVRPHRWRWIPGHWGRCRR